MWNDECQCGNVVTDDEFSFDKEKHKQTHTLNENIKTKTDEKKLRNNLNGYTQESLFLCLSREKHTHTKYYGEQHRMNGVK